MNAWIVFKTALAYVVVAVSFGGAQAQTEPAPVPAWPTTPAPTATWGATSLPTTTGTSELTAIPPGTPIALKEYFTLEHLFALGYLAQLQAAQLDAITREAQAEAGVAPPPVAIEAADAQVPVVPEAVPPVDAAASVTRVAPAPVDAVAPPPSVIAVAPPVPVGTEVDAEIPDGALAIPIPAEPSVQVEIIPGAPLEAQEAGAPAVGTATLSSAEVPLRTAVPMVAAPATPTSVRPPSRVARAAPLLAAAAVLFAVFALVPFGARRRDRRAK